MTEPLANEDKTPDQLRAELAEIRDKLTRNTTPQRFESLRVQYNEIMDQLMGLM